MKKGKQTSTSVPALIDGQQQVPIKQLWKPAPSLKPTVATMTAFVDGNREAKAIVQAWRFSASRATRIVEVSSDEHEAMVKRAEGVTF